MNFKDTGKCPGCNSERKLDFMGLEITNRWIQFKMYCHYCQEIFTIVIRNVTVFKGKEK